jgi:hypothetical protein
VPFGNPEIEKSSKLNPSPSTKLSEVWINLNPNFIIVTPIT